VRKEFRGRGLAGILVDKIIAEKGSNTLYVNIANDKIASTYRNKGFGDMDISELPEDSQQDLEGLTYADQVQKWMIYKQASWFSILKKKYNFQFIKAAVRKIVDELDGKGIENKDLMKRIGEEYRQFIINYGTHSEKAQLIRIKNNPMTFMPYTKLMRNYGYYPKTKQGTMGAVSYYGLASKSPNLRTTIWTMGGEE
jgi:predicted GNAT family acetyltransferase